MSKSEALSKLTETVRCLLKREGLESAFFEAHDVDAVGGIPAVRLTITYPDSLSPNQRIRAQNISGEECAKFLGERYG